MLSDDFEGAFMELQYHIFVMLILVGGFFNVVPYIEEYLSSCELMEVNNVASSIDKRAN